VQTVSGAGSSASVEPQAPDDRMDLGQADRKGDPGMRIAQ